MAVKLENTTNLREINPELHDTLKRYLKRVARHVKIISKGRAKLHVRVTATHENLRVFRPKDIREMVENILDIQPGMLAHKTRKREIVEARQIAMTIIYESYPNISLREVGDCFGGRDHSTVIHAKQTVADLLVTDSYFREKYEQVTDHLLSQVRTMV